MGFTRFEDILGVCDGRMRFQGLERVLRILGLREFQYFGLQKIRR